LLSVRIKKRRFSSSKKTKCTPMDRKHPSRRILFPATDLLTEAFSSPLFARVVYDRVFNASVTLDRLKNGIQKWTSEAYRGEKDQSAEGVGTLHELAGRLLTSIGCCNNCGRDQFLLRWRWWAWFR